MILYSFIIPIITCVILYIKFRKETVWWEYFAVFIPSILASGLLYLMFQAGRTSDIKFESYRVVSIRHYDKWDEWIRKICTERIKVGKDKYITRTYDCSYRQIHHEYWEMITSDGRIERIGKENYDYYRKLWGTPEKFIECNRRYYKIDGDAQEYNWSGKISSLVTVSRKRGYDNYFQSSLSLYSMEKISKDQAKVLGLYNYPRTNYSDSYNGIWIYDQNPIVTDSCSWYSPNSLDIRKLQDLNCKSPKDFRCFILIYPAEKYGPDIVEFQKSYWTGGNENEVIFCIGLFKNQNISWARSFSWSAENRLETEILSEILPGDKFYMSVMIDKIGKAYLSGSWKPLKFSDYSYISPELYTSDYIIIFIITILVNLGLSWYVITNEYRNY